MTQTAPPLFDINLRISWWDFSFIGGVKGNLSLIAYIGIVRHINRDDVYIEIIDPPEATIKQVIIDKRTLAYKVSYSQLEQAILETIPESEYTVYGLIDKAFPEVVEYVGCTQTPERRYKEHLACLGTNEEKNTWTREVLAQGGTLALIPLEKIKGSKKAFARERYWITYHNPRLNRRKGAIV